MLTRSFILTAIAALTIASCSTSQSTLIPRTSEPALKDKSGVIETVLYSFGSHGLDGKYPRAGLINVNGTLYGTTFGGGTHRRGVVCGNWDGCGTVFSITTSGAETVLYGLFAGGPHGANPWARLIALKDNLYGTTSAGGVNECPTGHGCGTVFSITASGTEKVLHRFTGHDGAYPQAGLINVNGTLYGTTPNGGGQGCEGSGCGTVFSITPTGTYHLLHSFAGGNDGEYPQDRLLNVNGILYGTTFEGGPYDDGTVFLMTTSGSEKVLHRFTGHDGAYPQAGLINVNGTLYGTTQDGAHPYAGLFNVNGTLYGTTANGGGSGCGGGGCGTVFAITTSGSETVLHSFGGESKADGAYPQAGLINVNGTLYGTTESGGAYGDGTVYSLGGLLAARGFVWWRLRDDGV